MKNNYLRAGAIVAIAIGIIAVLNAVDNSLLGQDSNGHIRTNMPIEIATTTSEETSEFSRQAADLRAIHLVAGEAEYVDVLPEGSTVLEAMEHLRSEGFTFEGREYPSLGFFVESINGKKASSGYYWIFYMNGKQSGTGISQTPVSGGDTIEWRLEAAY